MLVMPAIVGAAERWETTANLRLSADTATAAGKVLVVYVTMEGCPYCHKLEAELLNAAWQKGEFEHVHFVELPWNDESIIDFDGNGLSAGEFVKRYGIAVTPTMLFLGADGEQLVTALIGYQSQDYYWQYFMDAIEQSRDWLE